MPRQTWHKHITAINKPKPVGIKSQAKLPNGGNYTVCKPGAAEDSSPLIRWIRQKHIIPVEYER